MSPFAALLTWIINTSHLSKSSLTGHKDVSYKNTQKLKKYSNINHIIVVRYSNNYVYFLLGAFSINTRHVYFWPLFVECLITKRLFSPVSRLAAVSSANRFKDPSQRADSLENITSLHSTSGVRFLHDFWNKIEIHSCFSVFYVYLLDKMSYTSVVNS